MNVIICGLSARPKLRPHVTLLLTSRPTTLREARQLIELFNTTPHQAAAEARSSPSTWCTYHNSPSHNTNAFMQLQRQQASQYKPYHEAAPPAYHRDALPPASPPMPFGGCGRGRSRGRPLAGPRYQRVIFAPQANAAYPQNFEDKYEIPPPHVANQFYEEEATDPPRGRISH